MYLKVWDSKRGDDIYGPLDICYPHFMVKGPSHTINNILKVTWLISISLGLPDSSACDYPTISEGRFLKKKKTKKNLLHLNEVYREIMSFLVFTTKTDSNISRIIHPLWCVKFSFFLRRKEMAEIRCWHYFLWYLGLENAVFLAKILSMWNFFWFLAMRSVCSVHLTLVHVFFSLNRSFLEQDGTSFIPVSLAAEGMNQ